MASKILNTATLRVLIEFKNDHERNPHSSQIFYAMPQVFGSSNFDVAIKVLEENQRYYFCEWTSIPSFNEVSDPNAFDNDNRVKELISFYNEQKMKWEKANKDYSNLMDNYHKNIFKNYKKNVKKIKELNIFYQTRDYGRCMNMNSILKEYSEALKKFYKVMNQFR